MRSLRRNILSIIQANISKDNNKQISKLNFDGALEKDELGAGGLLTPPSGENVFLTCKLEFETTNNDVEYEDLILGLQTAETLKIAKLVGFGNLELVINQIKGIYQNRHIMIFIESSWYGISDLVIIQIKCIYRNLLQDFIGKFVYALNITYVPRDLNQHVDSLASTESTFKQPKVAILKYEVDM